MNKQKIWLYFSNTRGETYNVMKILFGAQVIKQHETYLGLPSFIGRSKTNTFVQLKTKVPKILVGWKEKLLSTAGREVLIKVIAQAISTYMMSCFKLPSNIFDGLTRMVSQF